jgi:hypothetical protein
VSELDDVADRYDRFARLEAPGRSDVYLAWAETVRDDAAVRSVLARIPDTHRQPPLVFAVSRMLGAPEAPPIAWGEWVLENADALVAECLTRSIQTNEPLRCAALVPALALVDGPIALLEIGASAGLCLYPDRFSYRYRMPDGRTVAIDPPDGPSAVILDSVWGGGDPPRALPEIVWRAGIDLAPLDVRDPADRAWLTGLVWPGEDGRRERIDAAADIAASDPPILVTGDGADEGVIAALAASAPAGATLVVATPGMLAHVPRRRRAAVIAAACAAGRWVTLDAPGLHDGWADPIDTATWPASRFALALDGVVLAAVDPLGAAVEWRRGIDADRG